MLCRYAPIHPAEEIRSEPQLVAEVTMSVFELSSVTHNCNRHFGAVSRTAVMLY